MMEGSEMAEPEEISEADSQTIRHSRKAKLQAPENLEEADTVLQALDREVDFYRKRAGQIFFFSLLIEVLILAGREKVLLPETWPLMQPSTYSALFIAVAAIGIALGSEYRRRIRILKDSRVEILERKKYRNVYPSEQEQGLSEIQVLYVVLVFLSSGGIILVWLNRVGISGGLTFWILFGAFMAIGAVGIVYSAINVIRWLFRASRDA
jgi:hypothetical protein